MSRVRPQFVKLWAGFCLLGGGFAVATLEASGCGGGCHTDDNFCSCNANNPHGTDIAACDDGWRENRRCCQSGDYCFCYEIRCNVTSDTRCACDFSGSNTGTLAACPLESGPHGGDVIHCCTLEHPESGYWDCECSTSECASDEVEVTRCDADALRCKDDEMHVDSCGPSGGGGAVSSVGATTGSGSNCDYSKWGDYCDLGCGDLGCIQFCESCDPLCLKGCDTNADCAAVGAGTCQHSETLNVGKCSKQPSICPN